MANGFLVFLSKVVRLMGTGD
ncbi:hypothetical protein [Paenibacillus thiaminolyticus]